MNVFRKLFGQKQKVEVETLETKIEKLNDQTQVELESLLLSQTSQADDAQLRKAAIKRFDYGNVLVTLATSGGASANELDKAACRRIAQLLDENRITQETLLGDIHDADVLLAIAGFCLKDDLEKHLLGNISDQKQLADICQTSHSARIRQHMAARIDDVELLKELAKTLKAKDKNAYKIIKTKLDAYKEEELKQAEISNKINELLGEIDYLSNKPVDKDFLLRFDRAMRRWSELNELASDEQIQTFNTAKAICDDSVANFEDEKNKIEERVSQLSALSSNREIAIHELNSLVNQLCELERADESNLASEQSRLDALKEKWQSYNLLDKPKKHELKAWTQLLDLAEVILDEYRKHGSLTECRVRIKSIDEHAQQLKEAKYLRRLINHLMSIEAFQAGEIVVETLRELEGIDADYSSYQESRQKQARMLGGLIRKALQSVEQGRLKQAIGIRHSIDEKQQNLDDLPAHLTRQIDSLDEAIKKMVDWQAYAVVPKKEALVEAMGKLVGMDIPPEALATKIKNLQDEWRSLSQSGKDRNEDLWQKFSELADKAFEPCKIYYQHLADERSANLAKREALIKQLNDFVSGYDWENADWRQVEKIIATAKSEIRTYAPVDRAANKIVQEAFDKVLQSIEEKLAAEFTKNKNAKQQLIAQAEKLVDIADMQQATDAVKRLQSQWKIIGRTHFRDSDKLWAEFRKHCDSVFEKKEKIYSERRAAEDELIASARNVIDKLSGLYNLPSDSVLAARAERDELKNTFNAMEGIPEKVLSALQKDFAKALDRFDRRVQEVMRENDAQAWQDFYKVCEQMNAFCVAATKDPAEKETAFAELRDSVDAIAHWPEGMSSLVKQRMNSIATETPDDSRVDELKLLCIRAEILTDKESPAEDKTRRMDYQVNLLKQGMGRAIQANKSPSDMAREWFQVGSVSHDTYLKLYNRFYKAWSALV